MDSASEAILALRPVTFRYKKQFDPKGLPQFGLVAEEVEKVNPDLVKRDHDGKLQTVRYDAVNAMLFNEFLRAHGKIEEQEAAIRQLKFIVAKKEAIATEQQKAFQATTARQEERIKALAMSLNEQAKQVQNVSTRLELREAAAQTTASTR